MENKNIDKQKSYQSAVLLLTVFVVGLCTIIYELLIGSISSYFLGDSILQFSLTIGLSMSAMGLGTLFSRYIKNYLIRWFVFVELFLGVVGGLSVPILFAAYSYSDFYYPIMISLIVIIGILIGLEIPLLTRIMDGSYSLRSNISNVLSLDYFGALLASLIFPFVLMPFLGIFKSSMVTGCINLLVAFFNLWVFRNELGFQVFARFRNLSVLAFAALGTMIFFSQSLLNAWESSIYEDRIITTEQSPYQRIVVTKNRSDVRLYLDGSLQFSSIDEYRYHESIAHIPASLTSHRSNVLVLGGGDGLLARELLKYDDILKVTIVDLDKAVTSLAKTQPLLRQLNLDSLSDPRVQVIHEDAFSFLEKRAEYFDLILADLPDPKNGSLSRLYSREFYKLIQRRLSKQGVFVTQATSPFFAKKAFWCIVESIRQGGFKYVMPYHTYVPSFGDWGFVVARKVPIDLASMDLSVATQYLDSNNLRDHFHFAKDLLFDQKSPNTLDNPIVLSLYLEGWKYWN